MSYSTFSGRYRLLLNAGIVSEYRFNILAPLRPLWFIYCTREIYLKNGFDSGHHVILRFIGVPQGLICQPGTLSSGWWVYECNTTVLYPPRSILSRVPFIESGVSDQLPTYAVRDSHVTSLLP